MKVELKEDIETLSSPVGEVEMKPISSSLPLAVGEVEMKTVSSTRPSVDKRENNIVIQRQNVGWFNQLYYCLRKNVILLSRRPLLVFFCIFSSVFSILLAWAAGPDSKLPLPPLSSCGTVILNSSAVNSTTWFEEYLKYPITANESWRGGLPIAVLALGPMFQGLAAFIVVHNEFFSRLLGVMRALGVKDGVFWASWFIPFAVLALINSILGSLVALGIKVHVYQSVYFGGILASLFFLQLSLITCSFFLASLCGTAGMKASSWIIMVILIASWIIFIVLGLMGTSGVLAYQQRGDRLNTPSGVFWAYAKTTNYESYNPQEHILENCTAPIVSNQFSNSYLDETERAELTTPDKYFLGCFAGASATTQFWSQSAKGPLVPLFLIPYFHFYAIWGNFLGYTSMPGRLFSSSQSSLPSEQLAIDALPGPIDPSYAQGTSLFPQGSTLMLTRNMDFYSTSQSNCPVLPANSTKLCPYQYMCTTDMPVSPTRSPSVYDSIGYLVVLMVMYMILASYWAQVFTMGNGAARKWYFPLQISYWLGRTFKHQKQGESSLTSKNSNAEIVVEKSKKELARLESESKAGVFIENVKKSYGSFNALSGISLKIEHGEVLALLGHNGAGKSTLSKIICCETEPTEGDIFVFGYSASQEPDSVRDLVGVCMQDDFLWPDLSVKEHLQFFAGLRGISLAKEAEIVQHWLESVDLDIFQNQRSSTLSGGMKRRLSVALATIGDRPLVIIDEGTTGLDPLARRVIWRHIEEIKENRVIILTTHAMEEADLLADTVAILKKGEIAALGSPLQLKVDFGSMLQFAVTVARDDVDVVSKLIRERFEPFKEWCSVSSGDSGMITIKISKIAQISSDGEDPQTRQGITPEALGDFVVWLESEGREYGFSNSSLEDVFLSVTGTEDASKAESDSVEVCCSCCSQSCITCCLGGCCRCCCCPKVHKHEDTNNNKDVHLQNDNPDSNIQQNHELELSRLKPNIRVLPQVEALYRHYFITSWTRTGSIINWVMCVILLAMLLIVYFMTDAMAASYVLFFILTLLLPTIIAPIYSDRSLGISYTMQSQGLLGTSYFLGTSFYSFTVQFVFDLVILSVLYGTPMFRSTSLDPYNSQQVRIYHDVNATLYAKINPGNYGYIFGIIFFFALTLPGLVFICSILPGNKRAITMIVIYSIFAGIVPALYMLLYIPPPNAYFQCTDVYTSQNVSEVFLDCLGKSFLSSASSIAFFMPPVAAIFPQLGLMLTFFVSLNNQITFKSDPEDYLEKVLIPALKDASCSGTSCTFPSAFKRYGQGLGYMLLGAILLLILGSILLFFISFPPNFVLRIRSKISRSFSVLLHPRKFIRAKRDQNNSSGAHHDKVSTNIYDEVVEETRKVRDMIAPLVIKDEANLESGEESTDLKEGLGGFPREQLPPVLTYNLCKTYPGIGGLPPKVALQSLSLHVPYGQVLGLLGQNGAGKTTALKILSGAHEATGGVALVGGYDISTERMSAFERLGNCPQFDVVWSTHTVRHHLEFFARLKGLPRSEIQSAALSIATAVGLGSPIFYERNAGELSGGMRRRLSIALSLIGAPSVLLLDEPSTGVDPQIRASIWSLVNRFATAERALIITTHSMLEADTLCNRIAIMAKGRLKVVATQQHLKDKYGHGYLLQLNLVKNSDENLQSALNFVRQRIHPDAKIGIRQAKTVRINLPKDIDLRKVFFALYSSEIMSEGRINQFLLSQASLEDVFISIGT